MCNIHFCMALSRKTALCPYKVTVEWALLSPEDRNFVLSQLKWLIANKPLDLTACRAGVAEDAGAPLNEGGGSYTQQVS